MNLLLTQNGLGTIISNRKGALEVADISLHLDCGAYTDPDSKVVGCHQAYVKCPLWLEMANKWCIQLVDVLGKCESL